MENKEKHNEQFLNQLFNKKNGFKTTEDYFSSLEDDVMAKLNVDKLTKKPGFTTSDNYFDTLENVVFSKLNEEKLTKKSGFNTPEDYFDTIESKVIAKLKNSTKETKVIPLRSKIARFASIAAAACMLLFVGLKFFNTASTLTFDNIETIDLETWAISNLESNEIINELDLSNFETNELLNTSLEKESIESYLENEEITTLLNEIE